MGLDLTDYPDTERRVDERRASWHGSSNDDRRDDAAAWLKFLLPILLAAVVAYYTAQQSTAEQLATVRTTEQNHFDEVMRRLALIQAWQDRQDGKR